MTIYYQGTDITRFTQVRKCVARENCGGRCDSLEIEFENAAIWYNWGPEENDQIIVTHNGYSTGILYLNSILPEEGRYRILASALPCTARRKQYMSFTGKTIEEIMRICARATGMDFAIYGIDGNVVIPYIQQENEGAAAFLTRLMRYEGAALKCINGKYTAVGINYAQERAAHATIQISAKQTGTAYIRRGTKYKSITVITPYAKAKAEDWAVPNSHAHIMADLPARNSIQAGRWARGLLLHHNRQSETLTIESAFNPGFSALTRFDITGGTEAAGAWIIEEAEHDFINKTSRATMLRCIDTIR